MTVRAGVKTKSKHKGGIDGVMKRTKSAALKVGLLAGLGEHPESDDGTTIVEVGAINEFGAGNVPERPFLRTTIAENHKKYSRIRKKVLKNIIDGDMSVEQAVGVLGLESQKDIIQMINDWDDPPNSPETEERKGANNPLIDTGIMKKSIHWEAL